MPIIFFKNGKINKMADNPIKTDGIKIPNNDTPVLRHNDSGTNAAENSVSIFKFGELTISTKGVNNTEGTSALQTKTGSSSIGNMLRGASQERTVDGPTGNEIEDRLSAEFLDAADTYHNSAVQEANNASNPNIMSRVMSAFGFGSKETKPDNTSNSNNEDEENTSNMEADTGETDPNTE